MFKWMYWKHKANSYMTKYRALLEYQQNDKDDIIYLQRKIIALEEKYVYKDNEFKKLRNRYDKKSFKRDVDKKKK